MCVDPVDPCVLASRTVAIGGAGSTRLRRAITTPIADTSQAVGITTASVIQNQLEHSSGFRPGSGQAGGKARPPSTLITAPVV